MLDRIVFCLLVVLNPGWITLTYAGGGDSCSGYLDIPIQSLRDQIREIRPSNQRSAQFIASSDIISAGELLDALMSVTSIQAPAVSNWEYLSQFIPPSQSSKSTLVPAAVPLFLKVSKSPYKARIKEAIEHATLIMRGSEKNWSFQVVIRNRVFRFTLERMPSEKFAITIDIPAEESGLKKILNTAISKFALVPEDTNILVPMELVASLGGRKDRGLGLETIFDFFERLKFAFGLNDIGFSTASAPSFFTSAGIEDFHKKSLATENWYGFGNLVRNVPYFPSNINKLNSLILSNAKEALALDPTNVLYRYFESRYLNHTALQHIKNLDVRNGLQPIIVQGHLTLGKTEFAVEIEVPAFYILKPDGSVDVLGRLDGNLVFAVKPDLSSGDLPSQEAIYTAGGQVLNQLREFFGSNDSQGNAK